MRRERQAVTYANNLRPFGLVIGSILSGLVLGILITLVSCGSSGTLSGAKEESYLVLAATLYSQGESLGAMKVYLNSLAPRDPATVLLQLADKYDKSNDRKKQQQAKDIRQLAEALKMGRDPDPLASMASNPLTQTETITVPNQSPQTSPAAQPSTPAQVAPPPPPPTPTPNATPPALSGKGVARPASGGGAIMREQPNTKSAWVASLPNGTPVEIIKVVQGEAVDTAESRWYLVKAQNKTEYVYFKLIAGE